MSDPILRAAHISKHYTIGERRAIVLNDISMQLEAGEFAVISGASGSGKTTLLTVLSGLDKPSNGRVWLDTQDITDFDENRLAPLRNRLIGFVFQAFHLVPSLTSMENIMFPAELNRDPDATEKASQLLHRVGLWEQRHNRPEQLSGGEKQRVAICRALINNPQLVFADEPTGNLDSENSREVVELLLELQQEFNTTLLLATHSSEISDRADRVLSLHDGRMVDNGYRQ
ncbi:MAG: ABC transporter ATP-binding protein [Desulfofustis sp.]|nr:ABC transporter ATP-binding protein [Desulfofustis sp.]RZW17232.1 MAG: ABC transporter ATP-binding protein [Desulfobulbaceae bacterium]